MNQNPDTMWEQFCAYLIYDRKMAASKKNTLRYRSIFFKLYEFFKDKPFTREEFTNLMSSLKQKGYKNAYINTFIKFGKHLDRFMKTNQIQDYTYFREDKSIYTILTPQEIKKLAEAQVQYKRNKKERNDANRALIYFLGTTGCRINEALSLTWKDIYDTPVGIVAQFRETKNGEDRVVPLAPFVYTLIQKLPKENVVARVFGKKDDTHFNEDLKVRAKLCKIDKKVWSHLFRHSFITHMLVDQGVDSLLIGKIVGHKDPATTQRYNQMDLKNIMYVLHSHELFRQNQTMNIVTKSVKEFVDKMVDKKRFDLSIEEKENSISVKIKKNYD